jgi:hypothetical protein
MSVFSERNRKMNHSSIRVLRFTGLLGLLILGVISVLGSGGGGGGTSGSAPNLTGITFTPSEAAAGTTVSIDGSFTFVDPDANLGGGAFKYTYGGTTYSIPLPAALDGMTSGTVNFNLLAILNYESGVQTIPCWLVDGAGLSSNTVNVTFTQVFPDQYGSTADDRAQGIAIAGNDAIYLAGTTFGQLDGAPYSAKGDVFLSQLQTSGERSWTETLGLTSEEHGEGVAAYGNDTVYVTGYTFGPLDGQPSPVGSDIFVSSYDAAGSRNWTRLIGTTTVDYGYAAAVDSLGNVYIAGATEGALGGEPNPSGTGRSSAALVKYNAAGVLQWTRLLGVTGSNTSAYGIAIDASNNIYITGETTGTLGSDAHVGLNDLNDAFVAKYNTSGAQQWVRQFGSTADDTGNAVATDSLGNVYLAGTTAGVLPGKATAGLNDYFLAKYNTTSVQQWVDQVGTDSDDYGTAVVVDANDNVFFAGNTGGSFPGFSNYGGQDAFLARYATSGAGIWLTQYGSNLDDLVHGVALDSNAYVYVTGETNGTLDYVTNAGGSDIMLLKYNANGFRQ